MLVCACHSFDGLFRSHSATVKAGHKLRGEVARGQLEALAAPLRSADEVSGCGRFIVVRDYALPRRAPEVLFERTRKVGVTAGYRVALQSRLARFTVRRDACSSVLARRRGSQSHREPALRPRRDGTVWRTSHCWARRSDRSPSSRTCIT
jgi:hypothetical protein